MSKELVKNPYVDKYFDCKGPTGSWPNETNDHDTMYVTYTCRLCGHQFEVREFGVFNSKGVKPVTLVNQQAGAHLVECHLEETMPDIMEHMKKGFRSDRRDPWIGADGSPTTCYCFNDEEDEYEVIGDDDEDDVLQYENPLSSKPSWIE